MASTLRMLYTQKQEEEEESEANKVEAADIDDLCVIFSKSKFIGNLKNCGLIFELPVMFVLLKECFLLMLHPELRVSFLWELHHVPKRKKLG